MTTSVKADLFQISTYCNALWEWMASCMYHYTQFAQLFRCCLSSNHKGSSKSAAPPKKCDLIQIQMETEKQKSQIMSVRLISAQQQVQNKAGTRKHFLLNDGVATSNNHIHKSPRTLHQLLCQQSTSDIQELIITSWIPACWCKI